MIIFLVTMDSAFLIVSCKFLSAFSATKGRGNMITVFMCANNAVLRKKYYQNCATM